MPEKPEFPVGPAVVDWKVAKTPPRTAIVGTFCRVEPLNPATHLDDLYDAFSEDHEGILWTYMTTGPFNSKEELGDWLESIAATDDPLFHTIIDRSTGKAVGVAAYLRIKPDMGVIEIGSISYSPRLQRTAAATEAMFLFMKRVFDDLGYRRYEWKCDSLNAASRRAAERLGFSFDGLFEQAVVYKGRNRDTAWYSILDRHWPPLRNAFLKWLDPANFDDHGRQKHELQYFVSIDRDSSP